MVKQKLEENRRVYEGGRFEKKAVEQRTEVEQTAAEPSRDSFQEGEEVEVRGQDRSAEVLFEPERSIVEQEEEELLESMVPPDEGTDRVRELSDELERLAQRYGRGMEEWLYDQSAV